MTGDLPCVFLMGPTGGGKTRLALALAERIPCEIVSVDSAQVYRGFDRGTAKPNPAQRARVQHHLIDVCEPTASYSAAQFRADALAAMAAIRARGRLPLLVGGTGLYFRALEQGLADLPPADPQVRAALAAELARDGAHALHARLAALDAEAAARIHPNDPQRLLRALEIHAVSGRTRSDWWAQGRRDPLTVAAVKIVLAPGDRAVLHARLATRFDQMLESGLVNEVAALRARGDLSPALPAVRCVGYREVWNYLDGDLSHDEMRNRAIIATRQLAKRQLTWLRGEQACTWVTSETVDLAPRIMRLLHERGVLPAR